MITKYPSIVVVQPSGIKVSVNLVTDRGQLMYNKLRSVLRNPNNEVRIPAGLIDELVCACDEKVRLLEKTRTKLAEFGKEFESTVCEQAICQSNHNTYDDLGDDIAHSPDSVADLVRNYAFLSHRLRRAQKQLNALT